MDEHDFTQRYQHVHFVGIGGSGMSGIAEVMLNLGYTVSGSDLARNEAVERLERQGAQIFLGHAASHAGDAQVVVASGAVPADNVELAAARTKRIPVVPRAEMLGELMRFRQGIAVAGSHGKTTTTSLLASILAHAGFDPTFVIGGLLNSAGTHARLGTGRFMIVEADESDASFLRLQPVAAVVTNIDRDHLAAYKNDFGKLVAAFEQFLHQLPFYGVAVLNADDPQTEELRKSLPRSVRTFGMENAADVRGEWIGQSGARSRFRLTLPSGEQGECELRLPGRHNVANALAAAAVATEIGIPLVKMQQAFADFEGVGRRFEMRDDARIGATRVTVIEDYGHHPAALAATIDSIRSGWPDRRLVMIFQPHRFSRTRDLLDDFANVLTRVDLLVLTEVYAAGERPIPGADGRALVHAIRQRGAEHPIFVPDVASAARVLADIVEDDDIVLVQGAGDVGRIAHQTGAAS